MDHHQIRAGRNLRNGLKVAYRVVRQLHIDTRVDRERGLGREEERVSVRLRLRSDFESDDRAYAGAVFDDYRLAPALDQLLREQPREDVARTAGHERIDD